MNIAHQINTVFAFFLKTSLKSRRTKTFFVLSLIPTAIILIVNIAAKGNGNPDLQNLFEKIAVIFFFGFFIQAISLFFGTAIINDEVSDKTLIYLTTKPISKGSILVGKYAANFIIGNLIMLVGISVAYIASLQSGGFNFSELLNYYGVTLITILGYMGLFTYFGTALKRPIMIGLILIFGWELIMAPLIGGTLQKLSLTYYINKLLPGNIFEYKTMPSTITQPIIVLIIASAIFLTLSILTFMKKEYILSDAS